MGLIESDGDCQRGAVVLIQARAVTVASFGVFFIPGVQLCRRAIILNLLGSVASFALGFFSQIFACYFSFPVVLAARNTKKEEDANSDGGSFCASDNLLDGIVVDRLQIDIA